MTAVNDRVWRGNLRTALAAFITENMPFDDPFTPELIDAAWTIAERLESRLVTEYAKVLDAQPAVVTSERHSG